MPVSVKTFATLGEAAAALSPSRGARYHRRRHARHARAQRGRHLVSTSCASTDRALARSDASGGRIASAPASRSRRSCASANSRFCIRAARSIGGPAVRNMGTVGGNLFAPSPFGDLAVALLALDATVSVQSGFGARDVALEEFLAAPRSQPGRAGRSASPSTRPASPTRFAIRKIARVKPKGASVLTIAVHAAERRRARVGRRASPMARWRRPRCAPRPPSARSKGARSTRPASPRRSRPPRKEPRRRPTAIASAWYRREVVGVHLRRVLLGRRGGEPWPRPPLQFRHNGREVAVFVDGGRICSSALRDGVGDISPKFGCGQGGCGACTVLIDGEPHLSCLTLAETVAGRSVETADGLKTGPDLHPLQAAFMEHFAAQCGYCTPGMLMAAKALLDRNPNPTPRRSRRGDFRQHLPLHRLRADHRRHRRRRRAAAARRA